MFLRKQWLAGFWLLAALPVWADCDNPSTRDEISQCLGDELRLEDQRINESYQALMKKLGEAEKTALRDVQRAWLKKRDAACRLDNKESNRERWFAAILQDTRKTTCVVRFTRARTAQLDSLLQGSAGAAGSEQLDQNDRYEIYSATGKTRGKWYFEVDIKIGDVARMAETAFSIGYASAAGNPTWLVTARKRDAGKGTVRYGFAVDLDNGKFYGSENGLWPYGAPGSNGGLDVKLGQNYRAMVNSSVVIDPLLKSGAVNINFGDKPFQYALPAGYRPFTDR